MSLTVFEDHPVQYRAPVYRHLQQELGVPTTVVYRTRDGLDEYEDQEFGRVVAWDNDLVSGYCSLFPWGRNERETRPRRDLARIARHLQAPASDAFLLVGYETSYSRMALTQGLRMKAPLLFRGETTDHARTRGLFRRATRDLVLRWTYKRLGAVAYIGARSCAHYRRLGVPRERMFFSPYCVDTAPFETGEREREDLRSRTRARLGIGESTTVLLFSGKLNQRKSPATILEAATLWPQGDVAVLYLGSGVLADRLAALAEKTPDVDTRFLGFLNQTELSPIYHAADLLVLPSLSETWGLVVNEALAHGLPCVASDAVGSAPDLVTPAETGDVFQAGSAASMAAALARVLPLTRKLSVRQKCRERVGEYGVAQAAQGLADAHRAVVGERGRRSRRT